MKRWSSVLILLVTISESGEAARKRATRARASESKAQKVPKVLDVAVVNDSNAAKSDNQAAILRAQILLDRASVSPGEIDGRPGTNFDRAIAAFQESRALQVTGKLDEPTWQALNTDTAPVIGPYRMSEEDVAGPYIDVPKDLAEQSKLKSLGYQNVEERLGEEFHVNPALLRRLNPNAKFEAGAEIQVPNVVSTSNVSESAPVKAAKVVVSKVGYVRAVDPQGKILAQFPASSGSEHDPLPVGQWKINGVAKNPPFHYNPELFWDADPRHSKAKIAPGPNNPVGVVWIDLSKDHYGIHGTPEPNKVGHSQSHGCIRLTNWDAMRLAQMVSPGVPAVLTE